jgi:hypothetical protein
MGEVRSRAGVLAAATGVAVLAVLPVMAFAQVPGANQVVGGVTDTVGGVVEAPAVPALPAPPAAPAPVPKAPAAPAPSVQAPSVQAPALPAPAPEAPEPAGSVIRQLSAPAGGGGQSGAGAGGQSGAGGSSQTGRSASSTRAAETGPAGGRRSHARSRTSGAGTGRHRRDGGTHALAAADEKASEGARADAATLAMAEDTADPLPKAPSPAKSPFTGFALALLLIVGLCALTVGLAVRRATTHLFIRRATS